MHEGCTSVLELKIARLCMGAVIKSSTHESTVQEQDTTPHRRR
jgi:hypothetical protein